MEPVEAGERAVGLRGLEVRAARVLPRSRPSICQLLAGTKGRAQGRLPEVQEKGSCRLLSFLDGRDQGAGESRAASTDRTSPGEGRDGGEGADSLGHDLTGSGPLVGVLHGRAPARGGGDSRPGTRRRDRPWGGVVRGPVRRHRAPITWSSEAWSETSPKAPEETQSKGEGILEPTKVSGAA